MRLLSIFLLLFFQFQVSFADGFRIITRGTLQGVVDEKGQTVIPAVYEKLGWSDDSGDMSYGAIGFYENGQWGLIDFKNSKLTAARFYALKPFSKGLFEVAEGARTGPLKRGLIDIEGSEVIPMTYFNLQVLDNGLVSGSVYKDGVLRYGVINNQNEKLVPFKYQGIEIRHDLIVATKERGKMDVYSKKGAGRLISIEVDAVEPHPKGYEVEVEGARGLYGKLGNVLHEVKYKSFDADGDPEMFEEWLVASKENVLDTVWCDSLRYDDSGNFLVAYLNGAHHVRMIGKKLSGQGHEDLKGIKEGSLVTRNKRSGLWSIYRANGRLIADGYDSVAIDEHYFYTLKGQSWYVYNSFGRLLVDEPYSQFAPSQDKYIPARKGGFWGWLDFDGTLIVAHKFEQVASGLGDAHFIAKTNGKWGVYSLSDRNIVLPEFDTLYAEKGFYLAKKGWNVRVYDHYGRLKGQMPYDYTVIDGAVVYEHEGKKGVILHGGKPMEPLYDSISSIQGHLLLYNEGTCAMVNTQGGVVVPSQQGIEKILGSTEGYFMIVKDGQYGFVNAHGQLRIANRYDSAKLFSEGLAAVSLRGRWGFVDKSERLVVQPYYEAVSDYRSGLAVVKGRNAYGIVDREGKEVLSLEYPKIEHLPSGYFLIHSTRGKLGIADPTGDLTIRPSYDFIEDTGNALIVGEYGRYGVIGYNGLPLYPISFSQVKQAGEYLLLHK